MRKERNKLNFVKAMSAWKELSDSQLLSSTDSTAILDRIHYKYKLSPIKYLKSKQTK
jgi:hypothetical protein